MKTTKEQRIKLFKEWIPTQVGERKMLHTKHTAQQYLKALEELGMLPIAKANLGEDCEILGDEAAEKFGEEVEMAFLTDPEFKALNDGVAFRGVYSAALRKYRMFLAWLSGTPNDNEFWDCWVAGQVALRSAAFVRWMRKQKSKNGKLFSKATVTSYESRLRSGGYRGFNFFAISSLGVLEKMRSVLEATSDYRRQRKSEHNALASAITVYADFLASQEA